MKKAAWSFALTFWGFQVGTKCINSNQNQICTFVDQIYLSLDYTWLWQTTHSCILKFICFHIAKYNIVMTVAIMPSMLQTHGVTASLSFVNIFLLSQRYNFSWLSFITSLVTVYWQLTVRYKEELQALECLFPSEQQSGGHSGRPEGTEPQATNGQARGRLRKKGPSSQFPKSQGWDTGLFKVQADNQKRGRW